MKSKWLVYAKKADFKAIEQKYGIDQVIARIMRNRDVCTDEEMQMYLNGSIDGLHAPELLKDAQKAVDILTEKIAQHKKIRIIGESPVRFLKFTFTAQCVLNLRAVFVSLCFYRLFIHNTALLSAHDIPQCTCDTD